MLNSKLLDSVAEQAGLSLTWCYTFEETGFLMMGLNSSRMQRYTGMTEDAHIGGPQINKNLLTRQINKCGTD